MQMRKEFPASEVRYAATYTGSNSCSWIYVTGHTSPRVGSCEAISVPLQCLCLAIFDAILVHMMQALRSKIAIAWKFDLEALSQASYGKLSYAPKTRICELVKSTSVSRSAGVAFGLTRRLF